MKEISKEAYEELTTAERKLYIQYSVEFLQIVEEFEKLAAARQRIRDLHGERQ